MSPDGASPDAAGECAASLCVVIASLEAATRALAGWTCLLRARVEPLALLPSPRRSCSRHAPRFALPARCPSPTLSVTPFTTPAPALERASPISASAPALELLKVARASHTAQPAAASPSHASQRIRPASSVRSRPVVRAFAARIASPEGEHFVSSGRKETDRLPVDAMPAHARRLSHPGFMLTLLVATAGFFAAFIGRESSRSLRSAIVSQLGHADPCARSASQRSFSSQSVRGHAQRGEQRLERMNATDARGGLLANRPGG